MTKADGTVDRTYDYLPFGQEIGATYPSAPSGPSQKFTGQERDAETGLDNYQARYMSAPQGRFMSPDDPLAGQDPSNPQSWNLFSYGLNNPLRYTDPTGHDVTCNGDGDNFNCVDNPPPPRLPILGRQAEACSSSGGIPLSRSCSRRNR